VVKQQPFIPNALASVGLYLAKHFLFATSPANPPPPPDPKTTTTKLCLRSTCTEKFPNATS